MSAIAVLGTAKTVVNAATAALDLAESLLPQISELVKRGEISVEDQAAVRARYESLKNRASGEFAGPEWQVEPTDPRTGNY